MRILHVAYPFEAVSERSAGGTEQIVWALLRELRSLGHDCTLLAREGSQADASVLPSAAAHADYEASCRSLDAALARLLGRERFDVVHNQGADLQRRWGGTVPLLTTVHLARRLYGGDGPIVDTDGQHYNLVSHSQRREYGARGAALPVIGNGIRLDRYRPSTRRGEHVIAVGRICPEKGYHHAIAAARHAGVPLMLLGKVYDFESHRTYFDSAIAPHLGRGVDYVESPSAERKSALLAAARCVLIPSEIEETSSLVAMEAAASGTPVICFRRGALPEIVADGSTGFVVDDVDAMAAAISRSDAIDPADCRRRAETHFSAARMAADYVRLYESIAAAA